MYKPVSYTDEQRCTRCFGRGTVTKTSTEPDVSTGIIMGTALGMGYFPMTKTVTKQVDCPTCGGSGKRS